MEKQNRSTAVSFKVEATIPFIRDICDMYAYEDAVNFYREYADNNRKSVTPPSSPSPIIIRNEDKDPPEDELMPI